MTNRSHKLPTPEQAEARKQRRKSRRINGHQAGGDVTAQMSHASSSKAQKHRREGEQAMDRDRGEQK